MRRMFDPMRMMRSTVELARLHEDRAHALVIALARLADALDSEGETDEALSLSREAITLIGRAQPPKSRKLVRDLADAFELHARRVRAAGDIESAVAARKESIAIREDRLAARDWVQVRAVGASRWELASDLKALDCHDEAAATLERALANWKAIADHDHDYVLAVARTHSLRIRPLVAARRWEAALSAAEEAVAIFRTHGDDTELAAALFRLAAVLTGCERYDEAKVAGEEAAALSGAEPLDPS